MKKQTKRIISILLTVVMVLSMVAVMPMTASAADYKTEFINALMNNQSKWYKSLSGGPGVPGGITFTDLNFDGKPELIYQYPGGTMLNCDADAFYYDGKNVQKVTTTNKRGYATFTNFLEGYYDKSTGKYRMFGYAIERNGVYSSWRGEFELIFNGKSVDSKYYASYKTEDPNLSGKRTYTYYNASNKIISKTEYDKIISDKKKNLVNINMKTKFITCSEWDKYSTSKKRSELESAYDAFKYDKFTAAPKLTSVNANNSGVGISWNKISGVPKYRVYKKVNGSWQKIGDTTGASYTDKSVKANNTYTYTVRGITANGSNFVTGYDAKGLSIKYTATPSITKREVTSEGIKLTWNKPAGTQKVRLYIKKNGSWSKIGDTVNTSYTYKNVKSGTSYAFTVRTVTTDGKQFTSGYSANGWSQKYVATPQISSLTNTKNGVQIKYNKPTGADKFRIYRKTGSGSWTKLGDTTATTYTDKTAKSGTTYSYTVRCISSDAKCFTSYYNTSGKSIKYKK